MSVNVSITTAALAAALASSTAVRADEAPQTASSAVSGSVVLVSDYVFRGLTQSWGRPSIQGAAELALPDGFVAGLSAASISEHSYPGGETEIDLYASYGRPIGADLSWRAGLYGYFYPGANLSQANLPARSMNTVEANVALSWKQFTLKYNRALTDYFGVDVEQGYRSDSRGTQYLQLDASFPLADAWSLDLHAGHTWYPTELAATSGARDPSYSDAGALLKYRLAPHWTAGVGVSYASNADFYRHTSSLIVSDRFRHAGGTRGIVMVQGAF